MTRTISAGVDLAGGFVVAAGLEAVRQRVAQRLRLYRGEAFLNADAGIPYVGDIVGQRLPNTLAAAIIAAQIRSVPGVLDVIRLDVALNAQTRQLEVVAEVRAQDGTASASVTI